MGEYLVSSPQLARIKGSDVHDVHGREFDLGLLD